MYISYEKSFKIKDIHFDLYSQGYYQLPPPQPEGSIKSEISDVFPDLFNDFDILHARKTTFPRL